MNHLRQCSARLICLFAVVLCLTGCPSTPDSVRQLAKNNVEDAKKLRTRSEQTIDVFKSYAEQNRLRELRLYTEFGIVLKGQLQAYLKEQQANAKLEFESKIRDIVYKEYPEIIRTRYRAPLEPFLIQLTAKVRDQKLIAEANKQDFVAKEEELRLIADQNFLYAVINENLVESNKLLLDSLINARIEHYREIDERFKEAEEALKLFPWGVEIVVIDEDTNLISGGGADPLQFYDAFIAKIERLKSDSNQSFDAHAQNLAAVESYLARPTEAELVGQGVVRELSSQISDVFGDGSSISTFLQRKSEIEIGNITTSFDNLVEKGNLKLTSLVTSLASKLESKARDSITSGSSIIENNSPVSTSTNPQPAP